MADTDMQADILGSEMNAEIEAYAQTQQILLASAQHDLEALRALLKTVPASVRDPATGFSPLHAAIASSPSPAASLNSLNEQQANGVNKMHEDDVTGSQAASQSVLENSIETLRLLLQNGAIWNDLDSNNETPGCLAWRLDLMELYEMIVDAGVRAELLMNRLDDFEILSDGDEDDAVDEDGVVDNDEASRLADAADALDEVMKDDVNAAITSKGEYHSTEAYPQPIPDDDDSTQQPQYLSSSLSFTSDRILDSSSNGVMMAWEKGLMERTASAIIPVPGLKVLNIGFGMGIFDTFVQDKHAPAEHHIIEAHPDVLSRMKEMGWDSSAPNYDKKNVTIHAGPWQDVLPRLVEQNITFDAIFFDTFAEDYKAFREFFSEYVIGLLEQEGRWSFFHGLGADRQVCYDVYTKVVEMDLFEAGFEVEWEDVELPELKPGSDADGTWKGVKRSYFSVEKYRLPTCKFVS